MNLHYRSNNLPASMRRALLAAGTLMLIASTVVGWITTSGTEWRVAAIVVAVVGMLTIGFATGNVALERNRLDERQQAILDRTYRHGYVAIAVILMLAVSFGLDGDDIERAGIFAVFAIVAVPHVLAHWGSSES